MRLFEEQTNASETEGGSDAFDLGEGYDEHQAAAEKPPSLLPKSKEKYRKDKETGDTHAEYNPVYLFEFSRPAEKQPSRFDENESVLSLRLVTVGKVKAGEGEKPRRFTIFDDIPKFLKSEEIRAQVLADDDVPEDEKEDRIAARLRGLTFAKRKAVSLLEAIKPLTLQGLQSDEAEGFRIGVAVGIRKYDGGAVNTVLKYLPASLATAALEEEEGADSNGGI